MIQESKFLGGDMEHTHLVKGKAENLKVKKICQKICRKKSSKNSSKRFVKKFDKWFKNPNFWVKGKAEKLKIAMVKRL